MKEFLDPLRTYKIERKAEYLRLYRANRPFDNDTIENRMEKDKVTSSFWVKLQGTFFMYSGYLGYPDYTIEGPNTTKMRGENHAGIYDYLTFGIPYAIEAFFRGNLLKSQKAQQICQIIFTIIPIVPALAVIRNGIGVIATLVSFFPVGFIHLCDVVYNSCRTSRPEKSIVASRPKKESNDLDLKEFMDSYISLSRLLNEPIENIGDKWEASQRAIQFHTETFHYAEKIRQNSNNNPGNLLAFFNQKKDKIAEGGKYSVANIQQKFG